MPKIYNLANYINWKDMNKKIYADTNIISPIYYDQSAAVPNQINVSKTTIYQNALSGIFMAGLELHLASIVIMEMINLFIKWDLKIFNATHPQNKTGEIKKYRSIVSEMRSRKSRYPLIFEQINNTPLICIEDTCVYSDKISTFLESMDYQALDVTDHIIATHVQNNNGILITDDHDYANPLTNFDIITGNQRFIQAALQIGFELANPVN